ncbi:Transcriptional regulatory protein moc3 [Lachnellula cervina]|uniref:Transcriptional regulatory protein moc3 n=1 Tax=Lachnellula cervina TaxID=1316786 RepID=A0A7D8UN42_9HELO|nr:Transcriptional regulatory protein moc3 [Lachnellula cervina]
MEHHNNDDGAELSSEPSAKKARTRTRTGCRNCRRRRRKCDERKPECSNCRLREESCEWGVKLVYKDGNAESLGQEHPSMLEGSRRRPRRFEIERGYAYELSPTGAAAGLDAHSSPFNHTPDSVAPSQSRRFSYQVGDGYTPQMDNSPGTVTSPQTSFTDGLAFTPQSASDGNSLARIPSSTSAVLTENAAADLLALRYLSSHTATDQSPGYLHENNTPMEEVQLEQPISVTQLNYRDDASLRSSMFGERDGIFLPGSAYQELHSTLRNHLISTARSNAPTRLGTPEQDHAPLGRSDLRFNEDAPDSRTESDPESVQSSKAPEISPHREYVLWKTWIDEVAPWLDKFDNKRHFEQKIPIMARHSAHLRKSILAVCARQIEQKHNSKSLSESLGLYQEAIHLLLPELQTKNTAVIASCVILCVLEMMSCSPKEWRRHLEGCANLLEAVGINGFVGGVEEALFWCFIRMDVCGALISQDVTLIPVERWASNIDLDSDIKLFRNSSRDFDTYAAYAVFLLGYCAAYLKNYKNREKSTLAGKDWCYRWNELVCHLDDWYEGRPEEMKPIISIPPGEEKDDSPFPTVLYGHGSAISGNQMYHTAALLMLQEKPAGLTVRRKQKSIFWHARQICAISESNTHHGAWTNSIQPIWIAGKLMSHPSEHRAILKIYDRIERDLGWKTRWRRDDLKAWWGDADG